MRKKLPIGLSDFRSLITENFLYVDKTMHLHRLCTEGKFYFFARPRRFGKTLTLTTLQELYRGSRELFAGLWIEDKWDWTKRHPVVRISMKGISFRDLGLELALSQAMDDHAKIHQLSLTKTSPGGKFGELLRYLHDTQGKVVVLIDEYDAPILDYLGENLAQSLENRTVLREFYTTLKECDALLELVFLTGVSKFSKVGIFSGLNNLQDISMSLEYATLVGYTEEELTTFFTERIQEIADSQGISIDALRLKMRYWYNGYRFEADAPSVYNPWSVQSFLQQRKFKNFWFDSGTPTFLVNLMRSTGVLGKPDEAVEESTFNSFEPENLSPTTLLFQSGYLTIKEQLENGLYILDYPNYEVHESLNKYLFPAFTQLYVEQSVPFYFKIRDGFWANDLDRVFELLTILYEDIPHTLYDRLPKREAFYHATLHLIFDYIGLMIRSEEQTAIGRLDTIVETPTHVYVLEFKLDKSPEEAIAQILKRGYYRKFLHRGKTVIAVGVNFRHATKTLEGWVAQEVEAGQ